MYSSTALHGPGLRRGRLGQLKELLSAHYKTKKTMKPTPWLDTKGKRHLHKFSLDLTVVDRAELATSMMARTSTTTLEQDRRDQHYARPRTQATIPVESLFHPGNLTSGQDTETAHTLHGTTFTPGESVEASACASTGHDGSLSHTHVLASSQSTFSHGNTAVWAGAGCGKTGTCSHIALLHSDGKLWPFFEALLLWRLREPAVQKATSLVQLLATLLPGLPESKLQEFADDILQREGHGVLAVLDGADELVEQDDSYVCRLLRGEVLTKSCLLATSRPCAAASNFFASATSVFDVNVELLGFSEKQVDAFVDESLDSDLAHKLKESLDGNPHIASLMSVPLLARLVCQVFESAPGNFPVYTHASLLRPDAPCAPASRQRETHCSIRRREGASGGC